MPDHDAVQYVYGTGTMDSVADVCVWDDRLSGRNSVSERNSESSQSRSLYIWIFECIPYLWRNHESGKCADGLWNDNMAESSGFLYLRCSGGPGTCFIYGYFSVVPEQTTIGETGTYQEKIWTHRVTERGNHLIYISHLLPDEEMKELVTETGTGVESIDFSISDNLDHLGRTIERYQKKLEEMGNPPLTLHGPFLDLNPAAFDSLIREVTMKRFTQCYQAGLELGAKKIVYHSGMIPCVYYREGWADQVSRFFTEFLEDKDDLEIVMENVLDEDWRLLLDVYKQVDHPKFKLCLDMGHAHCYSEIPVMEWAEELSPYISHVHVHDNAGDRDSHLGLGKGTLPYHEVLKLLPVSKERTWTIECSHKEDVLLCLQKIKTEGLL